MGRNPRARALGLALVVLVLTCIACELGFRALERPLGVDAAALNGYRSYLLTGELKEYEPRAYTVFQRPRSLPLVNPLGFNDARRKVGRTPGVPRVLCMGGSTTEGGNQAGYQGRYPFLLERTLEGRGGRDFEVMNGGISGWTTAEMIGAWFLALQDYAPDVIVLHEAVNDVEPRLRVDYRPDYSHWRCPIQAQAVRGPEQLLVRWSDLFVHLKLMRGKSAPTIMALSTYPARQIEPLLAEDKLPHASSLAFRRNMLSIALDARAGGAEVVLMTLPTGPAPMPPGWRYGIEEHNQHLRELCAEHGFVLADAARTFEARPELAEQFLDLVHLAPHGNQVKAEVVADALAGWVAALSPENARPPRVRKH